MLPALLPGQQGNIGRSEDWDWTMDRTAPPWTEQSRLSGAVQGSTSRTGIGQGITTSRACQGRLGGAVQGSAGRAGHFRAGQGMTW